MFKKEYIFPQIEVHEVQATHLMNTPGISGTGSNGSNDGDGFFNKVNQAPKKRVF